MPVGWVICLAVVVSVVVLLSQYFRGFREFENLSNFKNCQIALRHPMRYPLSLLLDDTLVLPHNDNYL